MKKMSTEVLKKEFTFGELARIALGDTIFSNRHLNILHVLFACLLRKMDCDNDIVTIGGLASTCLKKLLPQCHEPLVGYQYTNQNSLRKSYDLLEKLEHQTDELKLRLDKHFQQLHECNNIADYPHLSWGLYCQADESITSELYDSKICTYLLNNNYFLHKMRSLIAHPLIARIEELEKRIEDMSKSMKAMEHKVNGFLRNMEVLPKLICDIEKLRKKITDDYMVFEKSVIEIQEMLNCKLHRMHLPAIKQYIRAISDHAQYQLSVLQREEPIVEKPIKLNKDTCLSCSKMTPPPNKQPDGRYDRDSVMHSELLSALNQKIIANYKMANAGVACKCHLSYSEPTLLEKMNQFEIRSYPLVQRSEMNLPANIARRLISSRRYYLDEKGSLKSLLSNMLSLVMESKKFKSIVSLRVDKPYLHRHKSINSRNSTISVYSIRTT